MENLDRTITITNADGKEIEGEVLFTFEANGDDFILYGIEEEVFAAKIDDSGNLSKVEEDEWKLVEKIYNEFMEDMENDSFEEGDDE